MLTGGKSSEASGDEQKAFDALQAVQTPTAAQLTLPQLQQYVNSGQMTPAQATAALQGSSAYNDINLDPSSRTAEMTALNQMQDVSGDNGMTPEMQAQLTAALNTANTNTQGERGSIQDALAQRGVSSSLLGPAAQMAAAGNDAQTANMSATTAAGQAEQNALTAMANSGTLAGNINAQDYGQQANKAAAQNAINQWNAQNTTQNNQFNATNQQAANTYNTTNQQNVSNQNTGNANARTQYNAQVPQTVFGDSMQKAQGIANAAENQAQNATSQGQQQAGLIGGLIGGASQVASAGLTPTPKTPAPVQGPFAHGGPVQGHAEVPGDSPRNDTVPARLSPGEVVIPRSKAQDPNMAKQFVANLIKQKQQIKPAHPDDIRSMLDALSSRREAA